MSENEEIIENVGVAGKEKCAVEYFSFSGASAKAEDGKYGLKSFVSSVVSRRMSVAVGLYFHERMR